MLNKEDKKILIKFKIRVFFATLLLFLCCAGIYIGMLYLLKVEKEVFELAIYAGIFCPLFATTCGMYVESKKIKNNKCYRDKILTKYKNKELRKKDK